MFSGITTGGCMGWVQTVGFNAAAIGGGSLGKNTIYTNLSLSSSIYQDGANVTPQSISSIFVIKY